MAFFSFRLLIIIAFVSIVNGFCDFYYAFQLESIILMPNQTKFDLKISFGRNPRVGEVCLAKNNGLTFIINSYYEPNILLSIEKLLNTISFNNENPNIYYDIFIMKDYKNKSKTSLYAILNYLNWYFKDKLFSIDITEPFDSKYL